MRVLTELGIKADDGDARRSIDLAFQHANGVADPVKYFRTVVANNPAAYRPTPQPPRFQRR